MYCVVLGTLDDKIYKRFKLELQAPVPTVTRSLKAVLHAALLNIKNLVSIRQIRYSMLQGTVHTWAKITDTNRIARPVSSMFVCVKKP